MLNSSNLCIFEGRLTKNPEISFIEGANGLAKLLFDIAVNRTLTSNQRKDKKSGKDIVDVDFVPCEALGGKAEFIANNFQKGDPIRLLCSFKTYSYTKDGVKKYGYNFSVEDVSFTLSRVSSNGNNGSYNNNGNYNNNGYGNNSNGYNNYNNGGFDNYGGNGISETDIPF